MREIIKKRDIEVSGMTCEGCEKNINETLSSLDGVIEVKADKKGTVHVEYDLMKINLESIESKLSELNYKPVSGFFGKIKHGFIVFTEENEYDNMHAEPHSCCTLPGEKVNH